MTYVIAMGSYFIPDTGFDGPTVGTLLVALSLALKVKDAGGIDKIGDVVSDNLLLTAMTAAGIYVHLL